MFKNSWVPLNPRVYVSFENQAFFLVFKNLVLLNYATIIQEKQDICKFMR